MGYSSVCLLSVGLSFNKKMSSKIYIYLLNSARTQLELGKLGFFLGQTRLELDSTQRNFAHFQNSNSARTHEFCAFCRVLGCSARVQKPGSFHP